MYSPNRLRHSMHNELIDTCWDVNMVLTVQLLVILKELIDTCWDVNVGASENGTMFCTELIDTCWDVNFKEMAYMEWLW